MALAEPWSGDLAAPLTETPDDIKERIAALDLRTQAFIDGRFVDAADGATFETRSPITGALMAHVAACKAEDVDRAVAAARTAFEDGRWSRKAPAERKKILQRFADLIDKHSDELALIETLEMGKPIVFTKNADMHGVAGCVRWYAEAIDKLYDEIAPSPYNVVDMITREPMGVVGSVVPWNFPLLMAAWKFGPVLAAGNSIIVKPAEQTPLSILRAVELAAEAGIPDGVFQVLPGYGETAGAAIGRHMDIDCVAFTGSTEVGKYFLNYAGESNMKAVSLECGGKSPNIVFADTEDLDKAAAQQAFGIWFNSGQCCNAPSRLIIEESIKDAFLSKLEGLAARFTPNNPLHGKTQMGTILDDTQTARIESYLEKGQEEGAKLAFGGKRVYRDTGGYYIEPTVFDGVRNDMTIAREEIFGPVLTAITFKDTEEAVKLANDTTYGLAAYLFTSSLNKAHGVAKALRAGTVSVNNTEPGDITVPFGGYKQSGIGRDKSLHALEKYTQLKTTHIKLS